MLATMVATTYWYYWQTAPGDTYFTIADLPPGAYHIVAYANGSHNLIDILVKAGETVPMLINDWEGNFPANPVKSGTEDD
jgi:hypothetical protein